MTISIVLFSLLGCKNEGEKKVVTQNEQTMDQNEIKLTKQNIPK